ncbi:MAG: helix-turn-helix domain-containing protein [Myxococcales bacterium]|nr:helix-turn-helix domain-containing protein [Myxococcales bacterium]
MAKKTAELYTREEAAQALRVCIRSIDNYVHHGRLRVVRQHRQGRRIGTYIPLDEIERFRNEALARAEARAEARRARTGAKA